MANSNAERLLELHLKAEKIHFVREVKCIPDREFRFDFRCRNLDTHEALLVEVQGGVWMKGRSAHSSGSGLTRDAEKISLAAVEGYRTIIVTPAHIKSGQAVAWIKAALK